MDSDWEKSSSGGSDDGKGRAVSHQTNSSKNGVVNSKKK
jgi:hypothetical protein